MAMHKRQKLLLVSVIAAVLALSAVANGGDQRIVDSKFSLTLSRAPFTPTEGETTSMLISFYDISAGRLVNETVTANVRIKHLNGEVSELYKEGLAVQHGVLQLKHAFARKGLYEIFIDFSLGSEPARVYNAPDFLIDIQPERGSLLALVAAGAVAGFIFGLLLGTRNRKN